MTTTYSARSFGNRGRADMKKHPVLVGVVGGIVATLLLGVAVWLTIAYTGVYNVAASDQHFDPVRWPFNTTLRRSVAMRAGAATPPQDPPHYLLPQAPGYSPQTPAPPHAAPAPPPPHTPPRPP